MALGLRRGVAACALSVLVAPALAAEAEVTVHVRGGKVDILARSAPLSDVVRRLAEQTGMTVHYEGAPPRDLVTASLPGRSPIEAVAELLGVRGYNYGLAEDALGRVATLIVVTAVRPPSAPETSRPPVPAAPFAPLAEGPGSLLDLLDEAGVPVDEAVRAELEAAAPQAKAKGEPVDRPHVLELLERMSTPVPESSPSAIPDGDLRRLLVPRPKMPGPDPAEPPSR